ncbi:MAG: hypothetical protein V4511_15885 [Bacteroidota bacterium]
MLNKNKQTKLFNSLKKYSKQYLNKKLIELDESGTRLMVNSFLTDVLGFIPIDEIKTEYMIRGTYADYVIQIKGNRKFLVEVKALSFNLSDKHLRQAINYGANEGIEWALLTNGKCFDFYKIIFGKPIDYRKVFSLDLSNSSSLKSSVEFLQHIHKDGMANKGLEMLWNKCIALDPANVAGFLYAPTVANFIKKSLRLKYKHKFSDEEIKTAINKIIYEAIQLDNVKHKKIKKLKPKEKAPIVSSIVPIG